MITDIEYYKNKAVLLRRYIIEMIFNAESGHPGGSLSCIDLINFIYENYILVNKDDFVLSKGHAAPALYAKLIESDLLSKDNIFKLRKIKSVLSGHPNNCIPTIKFGLGSLGQGASVGLGIAIAHKMTQSGKKVFVLLGDGELNEGQVWESFYTYKKLKVPNLVFLIDANKLQLDGTCENISGFDDLFHKVKAFIGVDPIVINGHSYKDMIDCFSKINWGHLNVVIANTVKGKGITYMENNPDYHSYRITPDKKLLLYNNALNCLRSDS